MGIRYLPKAGNIATCGVVTVLSRHETELRLTFGPCFCPSMEQRPNQNLFTCSVCYDFTLRSAYKADITTPGPALSGDVGGAKIGSRGNQ